MSTRTNTARSRALHVVPFEEESLGRRRPLRSVDDDEWAPRAEIISIDSARSTREEYRRPAQTREPAMLAKWAVGLSVVMFLAALTSGQA